MNWLKRFMAHPPIRQISLVNVQDDELVERTKARQEEARKALGLRWIGHPDARPSKARLDELHAEALVEHEQRQAEARRRSLMRSAIYDNVRRMR